MLLLTEGSGAESKHSAAITLDNQTEWCYIESACDFGLVSQTAGLVREKVGLVSQTSGLVS
jgi:hypothetical protein